MYCAGERESRGQEKGGKWSDTLAKKFATFSPNLATFLALPDAKRMARRGGTSRLKLRVRVMDLHGREQRRPFLGLRWSFELWQKQTRSILNGVSVCFVEVSKI